MDELLRDLDALIGRYENELGPLSDEALDRRPDTGGWSAREALAHLEITARLYVDKLEGLLARHPDPLPARDKPHKHGLLGGFLLKAVQAPAKKYKAPGKFKAPPGAQGVEVAALVGTHRRLGVAAAAVFERRLGHRRVATPIASVLRMPARTAIEIQVRHGERHLRQALAAATG